MQLTGIEIGQIMAKKSSRRRIINFDFIESTQADVQTFRDTKRKGTRRQDYFSLRSTSRILIRFLFGSPSSAFRAICARLLFRVRVRENTGGNPRKRDSRRNRPIWPDMVGTRVAGQAIQSFQRFTRDTWIWKSSPRFFFIRYSWRASFNADSPFLYFSETWKIPRPLNHCNDHYIHFMDFRISSIFL